MLMILNCVCPSCQVILLTNFKHGPEEEECPVPEETRDTLTDFHTDILIHCGVHIEAEEEEEEVDTSLRGRLGRLMGKVNNLRKKKEVVEEPEEEEEVKPSKNTFTTLTPNPKPQTPNP
uniref:Ryanodine receptor junctional solenoid domain-containing protein n=1 Tax=Hucho hucho TaxID=62062 RepID=A0A4W5KWH3_9TELE